MREPGSYVASFDESFTPLDFFKLFFTEDIIKLMCKNSDKYAEKNKDISQVKVPPSIVEYNTYMGGVDHSDQAISYYNILRKTRKYWRIFFFAFLGRNGDQFISSVQTPPT